MGRWAPAPTPTRVLKMRGSKHARGRDGEPEPPIGIPRPPTKLPERVKAVWDKAGRLLKDMGVLTVADGFALLVLCRAAADYLAYCEAAPVGSDVLLTQEKAAYWN